jgi:hypothetical protein
MSQTFINENGEEQSSRLSAVDRLAIRDEVRAIQKQQGTAAWYNPSKSQSRSDWGDKVLGDTVYLGESNPYKPLWDEPVFNMSKFREARIAHQKAIKEGSISSFDWGKYEDPWIGEWSVVNQEYSYLKKTGKIKSAAVGTNTDFSAIDVINVLSEMVNTELRNFVLEQALTTIGTPQLNLNIDTYTRFTNTQGVPEGVAPQTKRPAVSRTAFNLTKDIGHVAFTDEAQLRAVHDIFKQAIDTAVTDMKRIRSNKIATELETATTSSGADWSAFTTDHNTTAPQTNLGTVADIVFSNNGQANIITSHDKPWRNFTMSTYIKGLLQAVPLPDLSLAKVITNVPALPGLTWYIDNEHTSTIACVFDKSAVYLMDGPKRVAQYRMEQEGIDGYIYRDWNLPKIVIAGRIRKLTGVS